MKIATARCISTFLVLLGSGLIAVAFVVKDETTNGGYRWNLGAPNESTSTNLINPTTQAIRYALASDAYSTTNTATELSAVRAAFAQWQAVADTHLKFEDAGLIASPRDLNPDDQRNVIYWEKKNLLLNKGRTNLRGRTGYTVIRSETNSHVILEADIVFNAVEKSWATGCLGLDLPVNVGCLEAVALHEIGHFIGLEHSPLGGATMFVRSGPSANLQGGLSADDIAAVRSLYPTRTEEYGAITGRITKSKQPVFGGAVYVHDAAGRAVAGTVTAPSGNFCLSMLPPGEYQIHTAPLDPPSQNRLCAGADIGLAWGGADTKFLPTRDRTMTVAPAKTNTVNFAVDGGVPAFRITHIRTPTANANACFWSSAAVSLHAGDNDFTVGVGSATLPTNSATLTITGDGLTLGPTTFLPNAFRSGLNFISAKVNVAINARPGLRTFVVRQGTNVAYAHGFLEITAAR